jgi:hypothetical protein|tara:strand:- start:31 stop:399 length:369 start_codon:yes stop_codon:yes gene_type:complete
MTTSVSDSGNNTLTELTTEFFNNFYNLEISYNPSEVDAVIGYFLKRGFEKVSAINTASVLLQQAKIDDLNVQQLLDTLKGVTDVQLSVIVAQILNFNRSKTSVLGFRDAASQELFEQRNVVI